MTDFGAIQRVSPIAAGEDAEAGSGPVRWSSERLTTTLGLLGLVLIAIGLRLAAILVTPSMNWWDEILQTIEPAHRLIYGYGLVPWEFQLGMRSWLLPGVIAGLIELSRLIGDGPAYYLTVIAAAFALLASAPVVCCFWWARRKYGLAAAFAGAAAVAVAPELVYFGGRALGEVVAAHILVIGYYLLDPGYPVDSRRRLFAAGVLLGLVCFLRVQLAPAVAIIAIWSAWRRGRAPFPAVLAGGLAAVAFGVILDWATLGYPLASLWRNVLFNLVYGVNVEFGTEPWNYYVLGELGVWAAGALFLMVTIALGARRFPVPLIAAIAIVAVHSCIAHKEYRFMYPAVVLLMASAGIGVAQLTQWGAQRLDSLGVRRGAATVSAALVLGFWGLTAFNIWTGEGFAQLRHRAGDNLAAMSFARHLPELCGIGLYGEQGRDWVWYGGYTYLHRPLPMHWPKDMPELMAAAPAFDTLLYTAAPRCNASAASVSHAVQALAPHGRCPPCHFRRRWPTLPRLRRNSKPPQRAPPASSIGNRTWTAIATWRAQAQRAVPCYSAIAPRASTAAAAVQAAAR